MTKKLKKQYRKIQEDWAYIRRYNDVERGISDNAQKILFSALYQINKYGHAVLTHYELTKLTGKKANQNRNLVKQLGFVLDFEFKRSIIVNEKKYRDCYIFTKNKNTDKILENPRKFFNKSMLKNCKTSHKKTEKDLTKNCAITHKKLCHHSQKIVRSPEILHIYNKNKDKINDNKENQNQFHNSDLVFSNSENVKTLDSKIETTESVEKSEKLLAKEKNILGNRNKPKTLNDFDFNDSVLLLAIQKSNKPHYQPSRVRTIIENIVEKTPDKMIYGGIKGAINYLVKAIDGEKDYDHLKSNPKKDAKSLADIKKERRIQLEKELVKNEIKWF